MDAVGPDEIQLPDGVERLLLIRTWFNYMPTPWRVAQHPHVGPGEEIKEAIMVSDLPAIIAQEREKWEAERREQCPKHGELCGRPNWTGYCGWRVQRVEGRIPDYDNALTQSEFRADQLEAERDQAKAHALAELREKLTNKSFVEETINEGKAFIADLECLFDALSTLDQED